MPVACLLGLLADCVLCIQDDLPGDKKSLGIRVVLIY
jgi:hypothetical protein